MEEESLRTSSAIVEPLPRQQRHRLFLLLLFIFVLAVPTFIFYAIGYRYNIFDNQNGLIVTGGMYIAMTQNTGDIYVNDEPARGSRIFRRATYIQSVSPGIHRVYVQGEGLHTWVKDLPIFPYMVTEAEAFLLPLMPEARVITEQITDGQISIVADEDLLTVSELDEILMIPTAFLPLASTTSQTIVTDNPEWQLLESLFAPEVATTATATPPLLPGTFRFTDEVITSTTTSEMPVVTRGNLRLEAEENVLFARYVGSARSIPHYFCVPTATLASTTELFGAQVAYGIDKVRVVQSSIQPVLSETMPGETRICRNEIRLDTKWQEIISFDFLPGSNDHVVVHRSDGIYVVEIDDRAWQNVQPLLPMPVDAMQVDNNRIYVKVGGVFLEISTELPNG